MGDKTRSFPTTRTVTCLTPSGKRVSAGNLTAWVRLFRNTEPIDIAITYQVYIHGVYTKLCNLQETITTTCINYPRAFLQAERFVYEPNLVLPMFKGFCWVRCVFARNVFGGKDADIIVHATDIPRIAQFMKTLSRRACNMVVPSWWRRGCVSLYSG